MFFCIFVIVDTKRETSDKMGEVCKIERYTEQEEKPDGVGWAEKGKV